MIMAGPSSFCSLFLSRFSPPSMQQQLHYTQGSKRAVFSQPCFLHPFLSPAFLVPSCAALPYPPISAVLRLCACIMCHKCHCTNPWSLSKEFSPMPSLSRGGKCSPSRLREQRGRFFPILAAGKGDGFGLVHHSVPCFPSTQYLNSVLGCCLCMWDGWMELLVRVWGRRGESAWRLLLSLHI